MDRVTRNSVWRGYLAELGRDLVDAGFGTGLVLVTARCAGNSNGADNIVAGHDRQSALRGDEIGQENCAALGLPFTASANFPDGARVVLAV